MLIDLSHRIVGGMTVFPGDPAVTIAPAAEIATDGFRVSALHLGTHSGTHLDAPSHSIAEGAALDAVPLEWLLAPLRILHATGLTGGDRVTPELVADDLENVHAGDIVAVRTGWSNHFESPDYLQHPVLDPRLAELLWERGVRVLGVDTLNPDPSSANVAGEWSLPVHELWLGRGGVIVENLTALDRVPTGDVEAIILPLNLTGLDGSPVRAVARVR